MRFTDIVAEIKDRRLSAATRRAYDGKRGEFDAWKLAGETDFADDKTAAITYLMARCAGDEFLPAKTGKMKMLPRWKNKQSLFSALAAFLDAGIMTTGDVDNSTRRGLLRIMFDNNAAQQFSADRAPALSADEVLEAVRDLPLSPDDAPKQWRNTVMAAVGFCGMLRSSELLSVQMGDVVWDATGGRLFVRTHKNGPGTERSVSLAAPCPELDEVFAVTEQALQEWVAWTREYRGESEIGSALFYHLGGDKRFGAALAGGDATVSKILRNLFGNEYSSHSLRRGGAQARAKFRQPPNEIMSDGGWSDLGAFSRYVQVGFSAGRV